VTALKPGNKFIIKSIPQNCLQKMLAFGLKRNCIVTIARIAPFNGILQLKLGSLSLGIRQADFLKFGLELVE